MKIFKTDVRMEDRIIVGIFATLFLGLGVMMAKAGIDHPEMAKRALSYFAVFLVFGVFVLLLGEAVLRVLGGDRSE